MSTPVTSTEALYTLFRTPRWVRGYDPEQVDDLLDDVAAALDRVAAGEPAGLEPDAVLDVDLATIRPGGYDRRQVDELLDRVVDTLREAA